jgi:hypothetical protein
MRWLLHIWNSAVTLQACGKLIPSPAALRKTLFGNAWNSNTPLYVRVWTS